MCACECIFFPFFPNHTCGLGRRAQIYTSLYVDNNKNTGMVLCVKQKKEVSGALISSVFGKRFGENNAVINCDSRCKLSSNVSISF